MRLLIGGDFYVSDIYKGTEIVDERLINEFRKSDYSILNLESPIVGESGTKINKTGPHLKSSEDVIIPLLSSLEIDMVTIANNHIMDYGIEGVVNTINCLNKNGINFVGIEDEGSLCSSKQIIIGNLKIGVLNFCENEWSTLSHFSQKSCGIDLIKNTNQIREARKGNDVVIVIIHGGHEYYQLPSPRMKELYQFYIDMGADTIIGHHTHCVSGYEIYKGKPIFYSLGNMLFTIKSQSKLWYYGTLVALDFDENGDLEFEFIPVRQNAKSFFLKIAMNGEKEDILNEIDELTEIINNEGLLTEKWNTFIEFRKQFINVLSNVNALPGKRLRNVISRSGINNLLLNRKFLSRILNSIRCEAHKDLLLEIIERKIR